MVEFIKITHSLNEALAYNSSGQEDFGTYYFGGVQLLPNQPYPYIQRTHDKDGIEIEDWQVWICDTCGNEIEEITDSFNVDRVFQDFNGKPQIEWSLTDVSFDFGYNLVLIKIQQGFNDYFYTTPFYLTNYNAKQTSRWDYRNEETETMLSCQLQAFYRQPMSEMNIASYNRVDNAKRVTQNITNTEFELWKTQEVDKEFFKRFKNVFLSRMLYVDFVRSSLWEGIETPEIEFDQNFLEASFNLSRDESQLYDPNYIAPPVPPPPPVESEIVLNNVTSLNNNQVQMSFSYINFSPEYVTLQYSEDGVNWMGSNTGSPVSPRVFFVPDHLTEGYYYRVFHNGTGIASNIIQLPVTSLTITGMNAIPSYPIASGNNYIIDWESEGFTKVGILLFEGSKTGSEWVNMIYESGNQKPKLIKSPATGIGLRYRYFRIRDVNTGIISNVFEFEF